MAAISNGRIWFVTTDTSIKPKSIRKRPGVAFTANSGDGTSVVLHGDAHVLDPAHPIELGKTTWEALLGPQAVVSYVAGNFVETARSQWSAATSGGRRVLVSLLPDRATVIQTPHSNGVLAVETGGGPIALFGRWAEPAITLSDEATHLVESYGARAAVAIDESTGRGLSERVGAMFRGNVFRDGNAVTLDIDRVTRWCGSDVYTEHR